jgi:hypothetical protein
MEEQELKLEQKGAMEIIPVEEEVVAIGQVIIQHKTLGMVLQVR